MNNHTDLLNCIVQKRNVQAYLEIGVHIPADNFDKIKGPSLKIGVDPDPNAHATVQMASDEFFVRELSTPAPQKFGLIFIDGFHEAEQLRRDIAGALGLLDCNGIIVCHDLLPDCEHTGRKLKPGEAFSGAWTGDCWKGFAKTCSHISCKFFTLDFDWGCGVIDVSKPRDVPMLDVPDTSTLTWQDFLCHRQEWLNIKPASFIYDAV